MSDVARDAIRPPGDPVADAATRTPPDAAAADPAGSLLVEAFELGSAVAQLAAAEASSSASAFAGKWLWQSVAVFLVLPAWLLLSAAALFALRAALGSTALACAIVGAVHGVAALLALRRAQSHSRDAGFPRTRQALRELARRGEAP